MTPKIGDAYDRYMTRVTMARQRGWPEADIIAELKRERSTIRPRAESRYRDLATDRNIYKKREVMRAAQECIDAIDYSDSGE